MKLRFVWVGKTKSAPIRELIDDYFSRVGKFCRVEVSELRDRNAGLDPDRFVDREAEDILRRISDDPFVVVLDETGRDLDSAGMARFLDGHREAGTRQVTFVIGGHAGTAESVKKRASLVLSLSRMTLTHELARVFLIEQVYRAFAILHGLPYQK